jgi:hypothetical protein
MFASRTGIVIVVLAALLSASPSAVAGEDTAFVIGIVKLDGKPLPAGRIFFHTANGQFVGGLLKAGQFKLARIPAGTYKVTFEGKGLPERFTAPEQTPLRADVAAGKNRLDFELASK